MTKQLLLLATALSVTGECLSQMVFLEPNQFGVLAAYNRVSANDATSKGGSFGLATETNIELGFSLLSATLGVTKDRPTPVTISSFSPSIGYYMSRQDSAHPMFVSFHLAMTFSKYEAKYPQGYITPEEFTSILGILHFARTFKLTESFAIQPAVAPGLSYNLSGPSSEPNLAIQLNNTVFVKTGGNTLFFSIGWAAVGSVESTGFSAGLAITI